MKANIILLLSYSQTANVNVHVHLHGICGPIAVSNYMIKPPITPENYIGFNAEDVRSYIEKCSAGKSHRRYFIIHGPPGTGKSTLINVLENTDNITMRRSNASDSRKLADIKESDYLTSGIDNRKTCIVLDEGDAMPKATWKKIEKIAGLNTIPIIIIGNNITKIPDKIRKNSIEKKITVNRFSLLAFAKRMNKQENFGLTDDEIDDMVNKSKSYRGLIKFLEYGYNDEMEIPSSQQKQIIDSLHGKLVQFKTGDLRNVTTIINDNTKAPELVSQADFWLGRYEHGYTFGKNIANACLNAIRAKKDRIDYPRTYVLIHKAKNKKGSIKSNKTNKKMPEISIIGLKGK